MDKKKVTVWATFSVILISSLRYLTINFFVTTLSEVIILT